MAKKQTSRTGRSAKKTSATTAKLTTAPVRYSDLPPGHPDLAKLAKAADDYLESGRVKARKKTQLVRLNERQVQDLCSRAIDLGMKFGAIYRSAFHAGDASLENRDAAIQAIEALAKLGSLEADAICHALGHYGAGIFSEDANSFIGPQVKEAAHG